MINIDTTGARAPWPSSALLALLLTACGGAVTEPERIEIETTPLIIEPGDERQFCYYVTPELDRDVFVRAFDAEQGPGGHHVVLFRPVVPRPDGTVSDCTNGTSMLGLRPLLVTTELNRMRLPAGLGVPLRAGEQIVVQSHVVNASQLQLTTSTRVQLELVRDVEPVEPVGFWTATSLSFEVPAHSEHSVRFRCTTDQPLNVLSVVGHMHEAGAFVSIDMGPPDAPERVYEAEWAPEMRNEAPAREWPADAPLRLEAGDVMDVSCTWRNAGDQEINFPSEMCAANAFVWPVTRSLTCVDGQRFE